jgi:uncharacterized protein (TIGR03083 family)
VIERESMEWMSLARDERADFAAFLATLSPADWDRPTLCAGWRVRDAIAHVISYDDLDGRGLIKRLARGWFLPARVNAAGIADLAERGPRELLDLLNGKAEPLLMAISGRPGVVHELAGSGRATLAARVER